MLALLAANGDADPSPWNPVTVTTAIIASLGFSLSLWNAWFNWRKDHPKVHMEHSWDYSDDEYEMLTGAARFTVTNRGPGVAQDVRIAVDEWSSVKRSPRLEFGDGLEVLFAEEGKMGEPIFIHRLSGNYASLTTAPDVEFKGIPKVTVTWHQLPNLQKQRSKTFRYKKPRARK